MGARSCVAVLAISMTVGCGLADPTLPPLPSEADAIAFVDLFGWARALLPLIRKHA
jgi:hypothetical protein